MGRGIRPHGPGVDPFHPGAAHRIGQIQPSIVLVPLVGWSKPIGGRVMPHRDLRHLPHRLFRACDQLPKEPTSVKSFMTSILQSRCAQRARHRRWSAPALVGVTSLLALIAIATPAGADAAAGGTSSGSSGTSPTTSSTTTTSTT